MSIESCALCQKTTSEVPENTTGTRLLCCPKCQQVGIFTFYCGRQCQLSDYKTHKIYCGKPPPPPREPFTPPPSLISHRLSLSQSPLSPPPSFLYYPPPSFLYSPPTSNPPSPPIPIHLSPTTQVLFSHLSSVAFETGNPLSVNLMYSLLIDEVELKGGSNEGIIEQLSGEYGFDFGRALEEEEEPEEEGLREALGGEVGSKALVDWQMEEAERSRGGLKS